MTPQNCNNRQCPRHMIHKDGTDICVLYQVNEKDEVAALNVFDVSAKQCKILREELSEWMKSEEGRRFAKPKEIVVEPLKK